MREEVPDIKSAAQKAPLHVRIIAIVIFIAISLLVHKVAFAAITIVSPINTTLDSTVQTFEFETSSNNVDSFQVFIGQYSGSSEYYNTQTQGVLPVGTPLTVTGLPDDGTPVNVRVYEVLPNGGWSDEIDFAFTAYTDNGSGDGGDVGGSTSGVVGEVVLSPEVQATLTDMSETQVYALEALVMLGCCLSFFYGWSAGNTR